MILEAEDNAWQFEAIKSLANAVINRAVIDSYRPCIDRDGKIVLSRDIVSAMEFLFDHGKYWLSVVDIDHDQFKRKLLDAAFTYNQDKNWSDIDKRSFKINYHHWQKMKQEVALGLRKPDKRLWKE